VFRSVLEILALTDKDGFEKFLSLIEDKLPCNECHEHLLFKLSELKEMREAVAKGNVEAFDFVITLHNMANVLQGKKEYEPLERLEEIFREYQTITDR
jgi:hypothetical protein